MHQDAAWKRKYMSGMIALAPPFAGAPDVLQSLISGPVYAGITPIILSNKIGRATGTWAAMVALLPAELGTDIEVFSCHVH